MIMYRRHNPGIPRPIFAVYKIEISALPNVLCLLTVAKTGLLYRLGILDETTVKR